MKRKPKLYFTILMLAVIVLTHQFTSVINTRSQAKQSIQASGQASVQQIPAPSLSNNVIGEQLEQKIGIYLPPSYSTSDKEYPVIYFLPGFDESINPYTNSIAFAMDTFIAALDASEAIVVIVNGMNKLGGSFYYNSPVTGNWEDFVTKDVVGYIDDNYRTIHESGARAIAGFSMGGFGVINIAMHTDLFAYAYSMSPGIFDENGLSKSLVDFNAVRSTINVYSTIDKETAKGQYLSYVASLNWQRKFSYAYGSAFAGDADEMVPFIKLPEFDDLGNVAHDEIWELYDGGFGNTAEKIEIYKDNLLSLNALIIEYGTRDSFDWIPEGCEVFSQQLKDQEIPHELRIFQGGHTANTRYLTDLTRMFSEAGYADPIPTPSPSPTQTPKPTQIPTTEPTQTPTTVPTQAPTSEPTRKIGDVNNDGEVKLNDSQLVLRAVLNIVGLTPDQKWAADVNGDGELKLGDAQMVLRSALNIISLP